MKPLLVSLGHELRGDDGVGPAVLECVRDSLRTRIDYHECTGDPVALLTLWERRDRVVVVDACRSDSAAAGAVLRLDALSEDLPADHPSASSHALGIASAIDLGRAMHSLPDSLTLYAVVGEDFSLGAPLSPAVARSVPEVSRSIARELGGGD